MNASNYCAKLGLVKIGNSVSALGLALSGGGVVAATSSHMHKNLVLFFEGFGQRPTVYSDLRRR
jgi:hypothetical protein